MLCVLKCRFTLNGVGQPWIFHYNFVRAANGIVENADYSKLPLICGMLHIYFPNFLFIMIIFMTRMADRAGLCSLI
jgi:hypothetical protein